MLHRLIATYWTHSFLAVARTEEERGKQPARHDLPSITHHGEWRRWTLRRVRNSCRNGWRNVLYHDQRRTRRLLLSSDG